MRLAVLTPMLRVLILASLCALSATAVQSLLWPWIAPYAWLAFFPAVFYSAAFGGRVAGVICSLESVALIWYLFLPPRMSWSVEQPSEMYAAGMFVAIGYLISESQERLRRSTLNTETQLSAVFEQAAVGIAIVAPDGRWLRVNQRLCDMVGYSRAELLGLTFQEITHPDDLHTDLSLVQQLLAGEIATYTLEKRYLQKAGTTLWIALTVSLVRAESGEPGYFIAVVKDIQERKQTELLHRESEARLQLFIQHAPAALAMFDRDMRYLAASQRWLDDYQLAGRDIIGCSHYAIFPGLPERWREAHRRGLAGEIVRSDEDQFVRADGTVQWLRWEVHPWMSDSAEVGGILIFTEDISARKKAEAAIRELNTELETRVSERTAELTAANQELDAFAYAVSHDLRAPVRALSGFSRALLEDHGDELRGDAKLYLEQIDIAARKMSDLIDGLLVLSRITRDSLARRQVDLSAMAERILAELARDDPGRNVRVEVEPGLEARCDERMVESVMRNLLGNAWKYTASQPAAQIRVFAEMRPEGQYYCVSDDGAGFDMAHAAKLFQPFQRLHRQDEFPGLGIGLATVQRVVRRHGGLIEAAGAPGKGAVFRFTLAGEKAGFENVETRGKHGQQDAAAG